MDLFYGLLHTGLLFFILLEVRLVVLETWISLFVRKADIIVIRKCMVNMYSFRLKNPVY